MRTFGYEYEAILAVSIDCLNKSHFKRSQCSISSHLLLFRAMIMAPVKHRIVLRDMKEASTNKFMHLVIYLQVKMARSK